MNAQPSRKRPFFDEDGGDEDELNRKPPQKKVRFPKGKKVKPGDEVVVANVPQVAEDEPAVLNDAQLLARARSKRRNKNKAALDIDGKGNLLDDVADAELHYEDDETLEDDGVKFEPFNLEQERKEGFFDQTGNYVEYVANDIKDAWLDSIDADPNLAQKQTVVPNIVVEAADLSSQDIGSIKRRIADALEPGETVLQALRRLKGSSSSRKEKMSAETKVVFDQLTEDAMKLMEDGDYNVYDEKQEVFQREAEGFEKLARARGEGTSSSTGNMQLDSSVTSDITLNGIHAADNTSNNEDDFDMFADNDDEKTTANESDVWGLHKMTMYSMSLPGTTTATVWGIIMTRLLDCIAMQHLDSGTRITKKLGRTISYQQGKPIQASRMPGLLSFLYIIQSREETCNIHLSFTKFTT